MRAKGRWSPTLDRAAPLLPQSPVAVKRGSSPTLDAMTAVAREIKACWCGERQLVVVFWGYHFVGLFIIGVLDQVPMDGYPRIEGVYDWVAIAFCIWLVVSLWRCAFNVESKVWGYATRIYVGLQVLLAIVVFGFMLYLWAGLLDALKSNE